MLHAKEGRHEWKCTRVGIVGLPGAVRTHMSVPASQKAQKVITGIIAVMENICHTLSHAGWGLKFAINLNFPLHPDKAFVVPVADAKLKVLGHNSWPGAITARIVCYLFCSVLIYWTNKSALRYWCSIIIPLWVTETNVGRAVGFWKQIKHHLFFYLLKSSLSDMAGTDGLHSK